MTSTVISVCVPEFGTGMDDPNVERLLSDPLSYDGLLASENLHGQPVRGRLEDGHEPREHGTGGPSTAAAGALVAPGRPVVRGRRVGGVGRHGAVVAAAAGKARVLRESRVGRGLHGGGHRRRRRESVRHSSGAGHVHRRAIGRAGGSRTGDNWWRRHARRGHGTRER